MTPDRTRLLVAIVIVACVATAALMACFKVNCAPAYIGCGGLMVLAIFINLTSPKTRA